MGLGRFDAAEKYAGRAREIVLDSYSAGFLSARIPLYRGGDKGPLCSFLRSRPFDQADAAFFLWQLELWNRNYQKALRILSQIDREFWAFEMGFYPKPLLQGFTHHCAGDKTVARAAFQSSRDIFEARLTEQKKDPWLHSALGLTYAGLDRREKAIRQARIAADLMPSLERGILGPWYILELAVAYTLLGEGENTGEESRRYFPQPYSLSIEVVLFDPRIDPIRNNPRFAALVENLQSTAL